MLVTFHSNAWSNITLFGDVAVTLLKMAGHSGAVPSALSPPISRQHWHACNKRLPPCRK